MFVNPSVRAAGLGTHTTTGRGWPHNEKKIEEEIGTVHATLYGSNKSLTCIDRHKKGLTRQKVKEMIMHFYLTISIIIIMYILYSLYV